MTLKYKLESNEYYGWRTGIMSDGDQVLMGLDINAEICIVFDSRGKMIDGIERCFDRDGATVDAPIKNWPFCLSTKGNAIAQSRFKSWRQLAIDTEQPIVVEEFWFDNRFIGIEPMPSDYVDFLDDPTSFDEEERAEFPAMIAEWQSSNMYVFWWNENYWMNPDGSVNSH